MTIIKKGTLVTVYQYGWKRRGYGHIKKYLGKKPWGSFYSVEGVFGLAEFHAADIRVVNVKQRS